LIKSYQNYQIVFTKAIPKITFNHTQNLKMSKSYEDNLKKLKEEEEKIDLG